MNYPERISAAIEAFRAGTPAKEAMKQYHVHGAAFYGELNSLGIPHDNKSARQIKSRTAPARKADHALMMAKLENKALQNVLYKLMKGELFRAGH